jgi:acetaldehyde dehydrogenase/alcohol dehydrogenase
VKWRYARIAHSLGLGGESETESVERLVLAIECLKREIGIPASIKEVIPESEAEFMAKLDHLAEQAFDDQCTGANPRYPLIEDLKTLLIQAYHGNLPLEVAVNGHGEVSLADLKLDPQPLSF